MIDAMPRRTYLRGMSDWIGIIEDHTGVRGWGFRDGRAVSTATGLNTEAILAQLGEADVLIVAPTRDAAKLPAKLLPDAGFTDLTDGKSRLSAPLRLQLVGFQQDHPNWDGVALLLTATHSYWCLISAGELVGFQPFLTPRLMTALHTPAQAHPQATAETLSRPERLAAHLAQAETDPHAMTGHLIGAELGAARAWWLGQQVAVIGPTELAASYAAGLTAQGVPATCHDDPSPQGMIALRAALT